MALPKYYNTGTISVANGATAVTGVGTAWNNIVTADDRLTVQGLSVRIASVTDDTHLTLAESWPGTTISGGAYEIAITYDGPQFQLTARELLQSLGDSTNLSSFVALDASADQIAYFSASGELSLTDFGSSGREMVAAASDAEIRTAIGYGERRVLYSSVGSEVLDATDFSPGAIHYASAAGTVTVDVSGLTSYLPYKFATSEDATLVLDSTGGTDYFEGSGALHDSATQTFTVPPSSTAQIMKVAGGRITVTVDNGWRTIFSGAAGSTFEAINLGVYRQLRLQGRLRPATDAQGLNLRFDTNNGASFDAGASDYDWQYTRGVGSTVTSAESTGATAIQLGIGSTAGNATGEGVSFNLLIDDFNVSEYCTVTGTVLLISASGARVGGTIGGRRLSTTERNAIQLVFASGNIAGGYITLEGRP